MEIARRSTKARELDMTPLIDIVFLLVIFFMLTTSFVATESMELTLPKPGQEAQPLPVAVPAMRIQIEAEGTLLIDNVEVPQEGLANALLDRLEAQPETPIGIFTTPGVDVQQLVSVMDMVYLSGGRKVKVERIEYAPEPIPAEVL